MRIAAILILTASIASAQQYNLDVAWDASATPNVTYLLVVTPAGGPARTIEAGAGLTAPVSNLVAGVGYTMVCYAVSEIGLVSDPSNVLAIRYDKPAAPGLLRKIKAWLVGILQ